MAPPYILYAHFYTLYQFFTDFPLFYGLHLTIFNLKHHLYQQHITDSPARYGQEHLPFPELESDDQNNGDQFRDSMTATEDAHIPQTVDDQKPKDRGRQHLSQILHIFWHRLIRRKNKKRQKSCDGCSENDHGDGNDLL